MPTNEKVTKVKMLFETELLVAFGLMINAEFQCLDFMSLPLYLKLKLYPYIGNMGYTTINYDRQDYDLFLDYKNKTIYYITCIQRNNL